MNQLGIFMDNIHGDMSPDRCAALSRNGWVDWWYLNLHNHTAPEAAQWAQKVAGAGGKVWGWVNLYDDPEAALALLEDRFTTVPGLSGSCLDAEKGVEGRDVDSYAARAKALGPVVFSLGFFLNAQLGVMDYQGMDGCYLDWQSYFDSGEGDIPSVCVKALFQPDLLVADGPFGPGAGGRTYRASFYTSAGSTVRWVRGVGMNQDRVGYFSLDDVRLGRVLVKAWYDGENCHVDWQDNRRLYRPGNLTAPCGVLLGFAAYPKIRVTLDVSSQFALAKNRTPGDWAAIAASARFPNAARRGVDLFTSASLRDETIQAVKQAIG